MEARATLRYMKVSAHKVRLVADQLRGRRVEEAYQVLRFSKKGSAKDLEKLLRSAVANAENSDDPADVDELVVSKIYVDEGPTEKRIQPASMGRAHRILKRQSHVTIHVSDDVEPVNRRGGTPSKRTRRGGAKKSSAQSAE